MRITYKNKPTDPMHPIMVGNSPMAKEFNKRQAKLLKKGVIDAIDFQQIVEVLFEILCDDYDRRHASRSRKPKEKTSLKDSKE